MSPLSSSKGNGPMSAQLEAFFDWAIRAAWDGHSLDGGEIQEKALELGLIERVPYSFDNHGPRGRHEFGLEDGDNWFVKVQP